MKIPYINLNLQWKKEKKYLAPIIQKVLENGIYVNSKEIDLFEKNISHACRTKYAVALNTPSLSNESACKVAIEETRTY